MKNILRALRPDRNAGQYWLFIAAVITLLYFVQQLSPEARGVVLVAGSLAAAFAVWQMALTMSNGLHIVARRLRWRGAWMLKPSVRMKLHGRSSWADKAELPQLIYLRRLTLFLGAAIIVGAGTASPLVTGVLLLIAGLLIVGSYAHQAVAIGLAVTTPNARWVLRHLRRFAESFGEAVASLLVGYQPGK